MNSCEDREIVIDVDIDEEEDIDKQEEVQTNNK